MSSNKYLEKIARSGIIERTLSFADDVVGGTSRRLAHEADVIAKAHALKITPKNAFDSATAASKRTNSARVKVGLGALGAAGVGAAGFMGLHKYHQHKDEKLMAKLDQMYNQ